MDTLYKYPLPDLSIFDDGLNSEERCGVIVKTKDTYKIIEVPNRHPEPNKHFIIHNSDVKDAAKDLEVIGIVHTHPKKQHKTPSYSDINSIPDNLIGIVYHPSSKTIHWYNKTGVLESEIRN